jgi:hypothetical protein
MYKERHKKDKEIHHLFRDAFLETSELLKTKLNFEKRANRYNLDSGIPLEDYFREEFGKFIPEYFAVDAGTIIDSDSYSCGDCDFVIYDKRFTPFMKLPSTKYSRRKFLAFETTYCVIEVKQTLKLKDLGASNEDGSLKDEPSGQLYKACKKLFAYKELRRDPVDPTRVITGVRIGNITSETLEYNKPITLCFFYDTDIDIENPDFLDLLAREFAVINASVPVNLRVNGLFILNKLSILWMDHPNETTSQLKYIYHPLEMSPTRLSIFQSGEDTLYFMFVYLWDLLIATHLNPPNLKKDYGGKEYLNFLNKIISYEF